MKHQHSSFDAERPRDLRLSLDQHRKLETQHSSLLADAFRVAEGFTWDARGVHLRSLDPSVHVQIRRALR